MAEKNQAQTSTAAPVSDAVANSRAKRMRLFTEEPIWKAIIKMGWPGMLMMFVTGLFYFCDTILAINFADDSYKTVDGIDGAHQVRMFTGAYAPIVSVILATSLLFAMGTSTRVSINLGRKDIDRAKNTIRTGTMISMILSFVMLPVLMLSANSWMAGQMENGSANLSGQKIADQAMDFAWIMIALAPFQFFNQLTGSLLRTEARNKQTMFATLPPVALNLLLDWVFMGPCKMGIEGAAWATFISTGITSLAFVFIIFQGRKHSIITFGNMFGKFKVIPVVGIILVGIAPFFRNMAQSITQTVEMHAMTSVGEHVYAAHGAQAAILIKSTFLGAAPIFNLFFPILFGFAQGAGPIAGFNYGAKNYKRVKQVFYTAAIYASITGLLIWIISSYALGGPLLNALGIHSQDVVTGKLSIDAQGNPLATPIEVQLPTNNPLVHSAAFAADPGIFNQFKSAKTIINILMITAPLFGFAISGMILLSSTDRFMLSLISSTLRGIILFFPLVYLFRYLAENSSYEYTFWWFFPTIGALTSIIIVLMSFYVIRNIEKKEISIDNRVDLVYGWNATRKEFMKKMRLAKGVKAKAKVRTEYMQTVAARRIEFWTKKLAKVPFYAKYIMSHKANYKAVAKKASASN